MRLSVATAALAAEAMRFNAPTLVEQALLRELKSVSRLRTRRLVYSIAGGAIAASLGFAFWMMGTTPRPDHRVVTAKKKPVVMVMNVSAPVASVRPVVRRKVPKQTEEQPFIAIPYVQPIEPYERAEIVRMNIPVAALIAAGLPMSMADPAASAQADVLVGQDGRARAVKLIAISSSNE